MGLFIFLFFGGGVFYCFFDFLQGALFFRQMDKKLF